MVGIFPNEASVSSTLMTKMVLVEQLRVTVKALPEDGCPQRNLEARPTIFETLTMVLR